MSDSILLSIGTKEVAKELYDAIVRRYNETNVVTTAFHALGDLISLKYEGTPSRIPRPKATQNRAPLCEAPTVNVAGAWRSARQRTQANKNAEYDKKLDEERLNRLQRTLEREAKRLAARSEGQSVNEEDGNKPEPDAKEPEDEWEDHIHFAGLSSENPTNDNLPESLQDAYNRPDGDKWRTAMEEELENLRSNDVYEEVPVPDGVRPITSKAAFRIKFDGNGNITRYKIRIVARGFMQHEGVDYNEVFAPVASIKSVQIIIALAAKYNLELDQMDVTGAYLNGMLDEEIYLTPPEGSDVKPGHCWRLKRSLYGLKQAGRTWNKTLDQKLHQLSFTCLNAETCLYMYRGKEGLCFLVIYVDDLLLAAASRTQMDKIKSMLSSAYKMHDLGPAEYILGM
jgi:hypothetical protein